jgi:hypothetical protein
MKRKVDNHTFLKWLMQSLNVSDLKQICREFTLKGYSKLKKLELIDFIIDSLSEEEIKELIDQQEVKIISKEIDLAINKINGKDRESIESIKIVNPDRHEVELAFRGFNWETTSFLSITDENIDNPERDCDCRIGANMGFCNHFWVGFIFSLKEGFFKLKDWTLTRLPDDFEKEIDSIILSPTPSSEGEKEEFKLLQEDSADFELMSLLDESITVYDGRITTMEKKEQDFQGNITVYYIVSLKNVKIGPRIQKKSDFKEEDIKKIDDLNLRISERLYDNNDLKQGMKLSANGKLTKDNFLKMYIVKNIRKIEIL